MPRFLILHGWQGSGPDHWQTWLADRLRAAGHVVRYPDLPDCDEPCPDRWGAALQGELHALGRDGERVVVCHSLACVLWLRWARIAPAGRRVERAVLVAPPCPGAGVEALTGFYPVALEPQLPARAAATTRLVCAPEDPYCPEGARTVYGEPLGVEVDVIAGGGHLNTEAGYGPWPAMEEWCLGLRDELVGAAADAAQDGANQGALT